MNKYRSKPVIIEAIQFTMKNLNKIMTNHSNGRLWYTPNLQTITIKTLEGDMVAKEGDWIIKGTEGEFYPCIDSVFKRKYEELDDDEEIDPVERHGHWGP